jgi:hypothetical protein
LGRNLRPAELDFFRQRMSEHDCIESYAPLDNPEEYVYLMKRSRGLPDVRVCLTDAYVYSRAEYLSRPKEIRVRNSFVVYFNNYYPPGDALIAEAKKEGVGLGGIGKFMGALNSRNVWEYETPEERSRSIDRWTSSSPGWNG